MPRAHDPRGVPADRQPSKGLGGPIPDFGQYQDFTDTLGVFIDNLLKNIKDWTGIDLYWLLDWSWTTNTLLDLVRQANDLFSWLQNPVQSPPNLLSRPSFSSPAAIAESPDWSWDAVCSLGTTVGAWGIQVTDPQGSAKTIADGSRHALLSNAITDKAALTPGQILVCQVHALVEAGFTAADDQAIRLEVVPSWSGVPLEPVVVASCGVPDGDPGDWIAAPVGSKAVFFDVDWTVPADGSVDTVELRLVVDESAGGDVPVRFDGGRVAAAGGFLVVLSDLFDAGRIYLTALWDAITAWLENVFDAGHWTALKTDTDAAFDEFVRRVKRALHHADADIFHPPSTSSILENALRGNPWFGWIFDMVDDWLQPVLLIGKAGTAFWETVWHAVTAFAAAPGASGAWSDLTAAIEGAWNGLVDAILAAWGSIKTHADFASPGTATMAALRNNDWFGWLFGMIDDWLQPVLTVGKAIVDFGDDLWHAITAFVTNPVAPSAWPNLVNALNDAWNVMVDAVLGAWGSSKTHTDFASPAEATEAALKNNPVTGWLWGNSFDGGSWLNTAIHAITDPIGNFFDQVRKYINQMIEALHWGYFDDNWVWVAALTTPDTELPGDNPVMTPGSNDGDGGGISPGVDSTIPAAPKNVTAIPWWDITVSGFPAGNITYAIAAVKAGVEGPATQVKIFVGTLVPPNSSTHVDLRWDAVAGASSYKVYRKVDGTYSATDWRLVASPVSAGTLLVPVVDKVPRSGGSVAGPKSDAELAAQIVKSTQSTASSAQATAGAAQATATSAATTASNAQSTASAASAATQQISDQIQEAVTGVPSSGAPISGISDALTQIPQTSVIPTVSVDSVSVLFDAAVIVNRTSNYQTFNHTLGAGANYLVVSATYMQTASSPFTPDVRINGLAVSLASTLCVEFDTVRHRFMFMAAIPLTTQAGTITVALPRYTGTTRLDCAVQSFVGVSGISTFQYATLTGSALSQNITTNVRGGIVSQTFHSEGDLSEYSGDDAEAIFGIVAGTVSGESNAQVTAATSSTNPSGCIALILYPSDAGRAGSGAILVRNVGANRSMSPANAMFPSDYYTSRQYTPDIDITVSSGVELTYDGWYFVRIGIDPSSGSTRPVLYKNGAVYRTGPASTGLSAHTFVVYCNVGDVLNAGYTDTFTAKASSDNVFEVALMSRSLL